ncbi:C4-dicarboxylate transporter DcuC [Flavobacterium anhuiense]|uniref:C4-dicarboxylate transporter DcuC n=1 Tax=Flavobacterium anhuiense TaxID=459526 RepID=UPI003D95C16F
MNELGLVVSILFIAVTAYLLVKKYNPQAVLLFIGLLMIIIAPLLNFKVAPVAQPTGVFVFDLFKRLQESLSDKTANVGLMIMTIGGFVAYMKAIGASDALVHVAVKPLAIFKKYPYVAASIVIPIGQVLFICTPSATGLGLLLVASFFPILISLGVSRVSAVAVISACTVFDMGPASANTARASQLLDMHNVEYFLKYQLPLVIPMTTLLMIVYFFVNRYYDQKLPPEHHEKYNPDEIVLKTPLIYAVLPVLPLLLLIIFSPIIHILSDPVHLDTTTAMLICLIITMIMEMIRLRNIKDVFESFKIFWEGMGKVFASVVTLIVCAEIFANGLISLGFINSLTNVSMSLGLGIVGIGILMTIIIFLASILMGSGNASFFSFSPLVPGIAAKFNTSAAGIILPMQLSSSMGRAVSPIAGVIVGIAKIADVQPMDLAKRNTIPMCVGLLFMLVFHYFI